MITLCMIVKDEARVIERCIASTRPFVDRLAIVDTGSTDDTIERVHRAAHGMPCKVQQTSWTGFGSARTKAFELAGREGYGLVVDADETLIGDPALFRASLTGDCHSVNMRLGETSFRQIRVVNLSSHRWRYDGVLHEHPNADGSWATSTLPDAALKYTFGADSARAIDPMKWRRDVSTLLRGLESEPGNARYVFYLAQSYRAGGDDAQAAGMYLRRSTMGAGINVEEVYISLLEAGRAQSRLGVDPTGAWLRAHDERPHRAEALICLARHFNAKRDFATAAIFARKAAKLPPSEDMLFVESTWPALEELALASYYLGDKPCAAGLFRRLLDEAPEANRPRIETNLKWSLAA